MPGMFENCHGFTINNGNFMNVKGDYNKFDNSTTHYIIGSNNTHSTVNSNSFNDQSREYGSYYDKPTIYQGPVNNIRHADNVNTGANHGTINQNGSGGPFPGVPPQPPSHLQHTHSTPSVPQYGDSWNHGPPQDQGPQSRDQYLRPNQSPPTDPWPPHSTNTMRASRNPYNNNTTRDWDGDRNHLAPTDAYDGRPGAYVRSAPEQPYENHAGGSFFPPNAQGRGSAQDQGYRRPSPSPSTERRAQQQPHSRGTTPVEPDGRLSAQMEGLKIHEQQDGPPQRSVRDPPFPEPDWRSPNPALGTTGRLSRSSSDSSGSSVSGRNQAADPKEKLKQKLEKKKPRMQKIFAWVKT